MQPIRVDLGEFRERLEALTDAARTRPVVITGKGAEELVVLSTKEWERLRNNERRVGLVQDLPEEWLDAVEAAEVPAAFAHLDGDTD